MTTITVANVSKPEAAQKFVDAINGKTYMNFQVKFAPIGGSFNVLVETAYDAPREEIADMLTGLMFSTIAR